MPDAQAEAKPITRRPKVESAAIAGIVYALSATAALLLFSTVPVSAGEGEWLDWVADDGNRRNLSIALNLAAVSAISFLWFVAVIRRRLGEREDKFFATVFFGSALVYVGLWLVTASIIAAPATLNGLDDGTLGWGEYQLAEGVAGGLLLVAGARIQAVFVLSTSMIFLRTEIVPKWLAYLGFVLAAAMFFVPIVVTTVGLGLPVFVLVASITILLTRAHSQPSAG